MRRHGVAAVEPTRAAQDAFEAEVRHRLRGTVRDSGCSSWYRDARGGNPVVRPSSTRAFRRRLRRFRPADFTATPAAIPAAA
jgi:hypothetical protein